jgi:hypothetical protein
MEGSKQVNGAHSLSLSQVCRRDRTNWKAYNFGQQLAVVSCQFTVLSYQWLPVERGIAAQKAETPNYNTQTTNCKL